MTSFTLAPNTLRMISAKLSGSAPTALPPRLNSRLNMSSQVFTGEVFQVAQTVVSLVMVPSQVSLTGSKLAPFEQRLGRPCRG